ncbi:MAG: glycosyltransferase [Thermodesulfobacteriota bacterium]
MRNKKILIAAPLFLEWDLGSYLLSILRTKHIECDTFAYQPFKSFPEAERELLRKVEEYKPDIVLGLKLDRIGAGALRIIRSMGSIVALWYVDCVDDNVPEWIKPLHKEADIFFTTAQGMVSKYREVSDTPSYWLYEGARLPSFPLRALNGKPKKIYMSRVAFVGSIYYYDEHGEVVTEREGFLKRVSERFDLKIWGPQGVRDARERWGAGYPAVEWPAYNAELVSVCEGADIVLGTNTTNSVECYFSNRTFITLASGGFHLTHYVPGLETMFENRKHLVWYDTEEECFRLIDYYLQRPGLRRRIALEGRTWVRRRYSMTRQVNKMLRLVERHYGN